VGVERPVTRWYIKRQQILNEIEALQAKLDKQAQEPAATSGEAAGTLHEQLQDAHERLRQLGPCPKPMMG